MASQQAPRPDFGQIKCPDCDTIMKPVTLDQEEDQVVKVLGCPKCGRRLQTGNAAKP
jgi:uncharacterized paraquat-inducible protein A